MYLIKATSVKFYILMVCVLVFFICCQSRGKKSLIDEIELPQSFFAKLDSMDKAAPLRRVTHEIAQRNVVEGRYIGIGAVLSQQYERYELLQKNASDSQLINLTMHPNACVRVYAFNALLERKYKDVGVILKQHLTDSAQFSTLGGCIGEKISVNVYLLRASKNLITKREYKSLKDSLKKYSPNTLRRLEKGSFGGF